MEIPQTSTNVQSLLESEFLTLKIDSSGKASLQVNIQFSLGRCREIPEAEKCICDLVLRI